MVRHPFRLAGATILCALLAACGGSDGTRTKATLASAPQPTIGDSLGVLSSKQAKQLFGAQRAGSDQRTAAYGGYAKGCLAGGVQLPETGPTWQAMRLSRNRNWAHPEMIDYVRKLSARAAQFPGWNGIYVGDMS